MTSSENQSSSANERPQRLGVVVIGRNEGPRLRRCLQSLAGFGGPVVYVDSGSSDRSVQVAGEMGVAVHELSEERPFSAARARNEGVDRLLVEGPGLRYVQFVDGDCEMRHDWLDWVADWLEEHGDVAAVAGVLQERDRESSRLRRLCDLEWRRPAGESPHCGGVFACRLDRFSAVGGFDPAITAGEEPELCARLRAHGGRIVRVDEPMGTHDSGITRFSQWWRRAVRGGSAQMANARRLGDATAQREIASAVAWGMALPGAIVLGAVAALWWPPALLVSALGVAALAAQAWRIARHRCRDGVAPEDARLYAAFCLIGKTAQAQGALSELAAGRAAPPPIKRPGEPAEAIEPATLGGREA